MKGKVTAAGRGGGGPEGPADPGAIGAKVVKPAHEPGGGGGPEGPADPGALGAKVVKPAHEPGVAAVGCVVAVENSGGPEAKSKALSPLEVGRGEEPEGGTSPLDLARRLSIPRRRAKAVLDEGVDETDLALDLTEVLSPVGGGGPPGGDGTSSVSELASRSRGLGAGMPAKRPRLKMEAGGFAAGRLCPGINRRRHRNGERVYK